MKTADQNFVKRMNKSIVLDTIKKKCPLSRAQTSEITGLNKATVSTLVSELIKQDLVYEIGNGQSNGGRRPVMLHFNKDAGYSIGVDLGVNYILSVLTDLNGNIVEETMIPLSDQSFENVDWNIKQSIRKLIDKAPDNTYGIVGIGIGVPGIVDQKETILFAPNLGWEKRDLRTSIENECQVPVILDNEANAGARGEKLYGAGQEVSDLVYVSVGIGIGTGIIIGNQLYKGAAGFSGEMGHFSIEANGKKCRCGNRGCWELYASENALLQQAQNLNLNTDRSEEEISIESLVKWANEGSNEVIYLFNQIGESLGVGLTNIVNTFNPELIIVGNRFSKIEEWISNPIKRVIEQRLLPYSRKDIDIKFSELSSYSCAVGSSSFSISNFFSENHFAID